MACDAGTVVMQHDQAGSVLDVGRKTRTIPPAIRPTLTARGRRCCVPGCESRHCDAHHVRHWADGGATRLDNLVLLCRRHHRAVHEGGFKVERQHDGEVMSAATRRRLIGTASHWISPGPLRPCTQSRYPDRAATFPRERRPNTGRPLPPVQ
jgi:hypothetical protein